MEILFRCNQESFDAHTHPVFEACLPTPGLRVPPRISCAQKIPDALLEVSDGLVWFAALHGGDRKLPRCLGIAAGSRRQLYVVLGCVKGETVVLLGFPEHELFDSRSCASRSGL